MTPERFDELLLDYLYDLLDDAEARAVRDYVQAHPEARARLDRARDLLAGAARYEFPGVRFAAPAGDVPAAAPAAQPRPTRAAAPRGWVRWAVVASVLLALGALAYPVTRHVGDYLAAREHFETAQRELDAARVERQKVVAARQAEIEEARRKVQETEKTLQELGAKHQKELTEAADKAQKEQLTLIVTGPPAIQPGAPNHFQIAALDKDNGRGVTSKLHVRVLGERDQVLFEEKDAEAKNGVYALHLPPDLPFKPDTKLALDVTASRRGQVRAELTERLEWAAPRYVTHLATDRPMYQPGQTVYYRSLTLNRADLRPPEEDFHALFTITAPSGAEVHRQAGETRLHRAAAGGASRPLLGPGGKPVRGVGAGEFVIPPHLDGGEYVLSVREANGRFPEERRKFLVNKYTPDRINKELDFHQRSYGPGDEVIANCKVSPAAQGGPVGNIRVVAAEAVVDNARITTLQFGQVDSLGEVRVRFKLPREIEKGNGSLTVTFTDGGAQEAIQKPIPIVLKKVFVDFYPEGGDLIAGVPNRVYFQARNNRDKPAEFKGRLLDGRGTEVARVETFGDEFERGANHGLGVFTFTPKAGETYELKIDQPAGIEKTVALLSDKVKLKADGVAMMVPTGVAEEGKPIRVELRGPGKAHDMLVGAYSRGRLLDHQRVRVEPGKPATVELKPAESPGGVVRVTAFEEQPGSGRRPAFVPRAERLVYRKSNRAVKFEIEPDRSRYAPRDKVKLTISGRDEQGNPARAVPLISVVDQTVVTMADEKTARSLPTYINLIGEVRKPEELEYADFLFGDHPKAAIALDLLLGVQGWRRFAEQDPGEFQRKNAEEAERMLVLSGQAGQRTVNSQVHEQEELTRAFEPKFKELSDRYEVVLAEHDAVLARQQEHAQRLQQAEGEVRRKQADAGAALAALSSYEDTHRELRRSAVPVLAGVTLVLALALLVVGLARGARRALPYHVAAAASLAAGILVLLGAALTDGQAERGLTTVANASAERAAEAPTAATGPVAATGMAKMVEPEALRNPLAPRAMEDVAAGGAGVAPPPGLPARPAAPPAAADPAKPADKGAAPLDRPGQLREVAPDMAKRLDLRRPARPDDDKADGKRDAFGKQMAARPGAQRGAEMMNRFRAVPGASRSAGAKEEAKKRAEALVQQGRANANGVRKDAAAGGKMAGMMAGMGGMAGPVAGVQPGGGPAGFGRPMGAPGMGGGGGMPGGPGGGVPGGGFGGRAFGPGAAGDMMDAVAVAPPVPFVVREYAFAATADGPARTEFPETLYWNPAVVLDESGKTTVSFQLGDSVTRYRILVAGHTLDGRLGEARHEIESRKAFSLEAKLPVEMTAGDRLDLPLKISNDTDDARSATIRLDAPGFKVESGLAGPAETLSLKPNERSRRVVGLRPTLVEGTARVKLTGTSEPGGSDGVERAIPIVPDGFPAGDGKSDLFASDLLEKVARHEFVLPDDYVKGTLKLRAHVYPSTLADLQKGLDALLREPNGCFEQTSTTNYPNTLILNYLRESGENNPDAARRAKELLDRGYQKLTSFECQKPGGSGREGYEWFGGMAPPHEALTAYGLLQFKDMEKVHPVDKAMVERTRNYLLSRRKPEGGFQRNERALDTFGRAPQHVTDAYILWALSETGNEDLGKDIDKLLKDRAGSDDPYFLSLVANALLNGEGAERRERAVELLKRVRGRQGADGGLDGAEASITMSGGRDLRIETTALAVLGWLKANRPAEFTEPLNKAIRWVSTQRGGYGGFGSTQSTILALKALVAYTKANKRTAEGGELRLYAGEKLIGSTRFEAGRTEPVTVEVAEPEKFVRPGKNELRLELSTRGSYPYTIAWSYASLTPASSDKCQVRLGTKLDKERAGEGEGVRLNVTLENVAGAGKGLPMTVAVVGLPAGLKVPEDMKQLRQMAELRRGANGELESGEISFFELRGRELVLYWRDLKPGAKVELGIDLVADIPGQFRGPASRAYLYYTADDKHWVEPLAITISAGKNQ